MKTYVKLVRPDYSSFYNPAFKWPVKGIVEVKNVSENGPCGPGLHLGVSVEKSLQYAKFPFRILKVKPLSPILGQDDSKIRVAKAESMGEIPVPKWARDLEGRLKALPEEMKAIPWLRGINGEQAKKLIRSHFKLLVPFGFKLDFSIEIITNRQQAAAARDAAKAAARDAARDAAWDVSGIKKPNPFKPLWECWKLGAWPIGFVGNTFKIYCAKKEGKKP